MLKIIVLYGAIDYCYSVYGVGSTYDMIQFLVSSHHIFKIGSRLSVGAFAT